MTRREGYAQLNAMGRRQGDKGQHPIVVQEKALNFVQAHSKKGGVLSVGYFMTKRGQFCITMALLVGSQVIQSPSLELMAGGMGAVVAARVLIDLSRQHKSSISYDELAIQAFENDPDACNGGWQ